MTPIAESWRSIERDLSALAPQIAATLADPATDADLRMLEGSLGLVVPPELSASLKIHNGQRDASRLWGFSGCGLLLCSAEILEWWRVSDEVYRSELGLPPPVPNVAYTPKPWWKSTLIPFTCAEGNLLCVDTDPETFGQVVLHVHDDGLALGIAASYAAWLADVATRIHAGFLEVDPRGFSELKVDW